MLILYVYTRLNNKSLKILAITNFPSMQFSIEQAARVSHLIITGDEG